MDFGWNVTMWNCWYGVSVSNAYWSMVHGGDGAGGGLTRGGDKPVLWRVT